MVWDPNASGSTSQADNQTTAPVNAGTDAVPSGARTVSGDSGSLRVGADKLNFLIDVTAVTGTTPSMTLTVEWSHDGTTWFPADPTDSLGAAITVPIKRAKMLDTKGQFCQVKWAITGTTPSFTFAVHIFGLDY